MKNISLFYLKFVKSKNIFIKLFRYLLLPLEFTLRVICISRRYVYKKGYISSYNPKKTSVISVGNIIAGGTGKTLIIESMLSYFLSKGRNVAVVSRGYNSFTKEGLNDEAIMLKKIYPNVKILCDPNRKKLIQELDAQKDIDIILMDDGFQYFKVKKKVEIVLIDSLCPWGYSYLYPIGLLREPITALKDADIVVITHTEQISTKTLNNIVNKISRYFNGPYIIAKNFPQYFGDMEEKRYSLKELENENVIAFSGIGNNSYFFSFLENIGIHLVKTINFPDHYIYSSQDISFLNAIAKKEKGVLVTTHKDIVKIKREWSSIPIYYLKVKTDLPEDFFIAIEKLLESKNI